MAGFNLQSTFYNSSGKPYTTTQAYSGGNKSQSTLIQTVLPFSTGSTNTLLNPLRVDYNNGNLSGEQVPSPFLPGVGVTTTKQDISLGDFRYVDSNWGNYAGTQIERPTMCFKYVPCNYDLASSSTSQVDLWGECTTKMVDKVNYQSVNADALSEQSASDTHGLYIAPNSLATNGSMLGTIKTTAAAGSYAFCPYTLGNLETVSTSGNESFKVPQTDGNQTVVIAFWLKYSNLSPIPNYSSTIPGTYLWGNDIKTSSTSWNRFGIACALTSVGQLRFFKGDGTSFSQYYGTRTVEDEWNFVFVRLSGRGNTFNDYLNMCWSYTPGPRGPYQWQKFMGSINSSGANAGDIDYATSSGQGGLMFSPNFALTSQVVNSQAEIGHFYMFYEHWKGSQNRITTTTGGTYLSQMEEMMQTTNSGSNEIYTS